MTLVPTSAKSAGGASNLVLIKDTLLAADAASIDITSIPAAYLHLLIVAQFRSTVAAVGDFLITRMNGDTGNHYYDQNFDANGTVASASQDVAQARLIGNMVGDSAPAGAFTSYCSLLPSYASANTKTLLDQSGEVRALAGNYHYNAGAGMWNSTAAVNELTFSAFTGPNLKAGSRVTVYGLAIN